MMKGRRKESGFDPRRLDCFISRLFQNIRMGQIDVKPI